MDEDEDSRSFLRMLDAAAERIFIEACSEIRAAEASAVSVVCNIEPSRRSLRSVRNTIYPPSEVSSSRRESRKRRKRSRTSDQPVLQQEFPARKIGLGLDEKTRPSVGWPQNFTARGHGIGNSVNALEPREVLSLGKNSDQPVWRTDFRLQRNSSNAGSVGYSGNSILAGAVLPPIGGIDAKSETEDMEKSEDFSKEIHDAIGRIETLIPSLQKLVSFVQRPTDQKNVCSLDLQNDYSSSTLGDAPVNVLGKAKCWDVARNKLDNAGKTAEFSMDVNRNPREGRSSTSLSSNQKARLIQAHQVKGNAKSFRKERFNEASTETGVTGLPAERDGRVKREGNQTGMSQVRGQHVQARMDRVESLRRTSGRSESVTSRSPEHLLGLRNMPACQCSRNVFNQKKATSKQALQSDAASRYQTRVPSVGSSSFRRPNKSSKSDSFNYTANQSHARERRMQIREPAHRNSLRRKSPYSSSRNMITLQHQISEETNSPASTTGTSSQQSGYPTSLSGSYQSTDSYSTAPTGGSDESEGGYRKAHHQSGRRKWSGSSASYTDETSSHYSSQDQYSDTVTSSQGSSDRPHRREHHRKEGKRVGRISKLRKKLGTIFHHHHHHHHRHYSARDEPDEGHTSFFKRLGNMFQRTGKTDHKRLKAEKSHEPVSNALVKKKQHGSHFRALLDGFTRHMKHTKKAKKAKDDIGRLASVRHRGKRAKKKPPLWPKMGKGKLKLPNKGKVKFGTRARRPKFAAAKMILRQ